MSKKKRWDRKKKRKEKNTLHDDVHKQLLDMFKSGQGRSRKQDKIHGEDKDFIYSSRTYETYKANGKLFVDFVKMKHPEVLHLKECRPFVNEWIQFQIDAGYSAWTISTRKAAVSKLLKIPYTELIATPSRCRANIQRSRAAVERDRHISEEKEAYYARITSATGLRRHELIKIRGTDLKTGIDEEGKEYYFLAVTKGTKGGRHRTALICGENQDETLQIVRMFREKGNALVCPRLPSAFDNHFYRSRYAQRLYGIICPSCRRNPEKGALYHEKRQGGGNT